MKFFRLQVALAFASLLVASAAWSQVSIVALRDDPAPGTNGGTLLISPIVEPSINDAGHVAFSSAVGASPITHGVFLSSSGTLSDVVLRGDAAPDTGGGTFDIFSDPVINNAGEIAFMASVTGGTASAGIFVVSGGIARAVALEGATAPGSGGNFVTFNRPDLGDNGDIAFTARYTAPFLQNAVFRESAGVLSKVVVYGDPTPTLGRTYRNSGDPAINALGELAHQAESSGGGAPNGFYLYSGGIDSEVVLEGETAPDTGGGLFNLVYTEKPAIDSTGTVYFRSLVGAGSVPHGLFSATANTFEALALPGDLLPNAGGASFQAFQKSPAVNAVGVVAFQAFVTGGTGNSGIFRISGGVVETLLLAGDPLPGGLTVVATEARPAISNTGAVVFHATMTGGNSGGLVVVPEPTGPLALGIGIAMLVFVARIQKNWSSAESETLVRSGRGFRIGPLLILCLFAISAWTSEAVAASFTWTGSPASCNLFNPCSWSDAWNWSPSGGPRSDGDSATIALNVRISLTENDGVVLGGLLMENGAEVRTNGYMLDASGGNSFLFGTGTTGGNTKLVVSDAEFFFFGFTAYFLSLHQGAELAMRGGRVVSTFGINLSASSLISGYGTVFLASTGTRFDVAGTVRPDGGKLILQSTAVDRIDLDGNVGGSEPGQLDVTAFGDLLVQGSLTDAFSGILNIGNSNRVEFDTAVEIDGEVNFTSDVDNELIAPSIVFEAGARITVDQATGRIDAISEWPQGATIQLLGTDDVLWLEGDSTFGATTVFSGPGLLINDSDRTMSLEAGADMSTALLNYGTLEIGGSTGSVLLEYFEQKAGHLAVSLGGTSAGGFDQLSITEDAALAGSLDVSLVGNFQLSPGDSFEIIRVDGVSTGIFNGLGEASIVGTFGGEDLFITYSGGDGNDVVLYTVPEPGLAAGLIIGTMMLAGMGRVPARTRIVRALGTDVNRPGETQSSRPPNAMGRQSQTEIPLRFAATRTLGCLGS